MFMPTILIWHSLPYPVDFRGVFTGVKLPRDKLYTQLYLATILCVRGLIELVRNLVAHSDAREGK